MAKKKKQEPVVVQNTPLIPTTIGVIDTKENGPIVAIVIIILFLLGIFFMDDITAFFHPTSAPSNPTVPTTPGENPTTPLTPSEEIKYYDFKNDLEIDMNGFQITNFKVDETKSTISFRVSNVNGDENYFKDNQFYLELYNTEKTLLERLKIANDSITTFRNFSFIVQNTKIASLAFVKKDVTDYPNVSLKVNSNEQPYLTCQNSDITYEYIFTEKDEVYLLKQINETKTFLTSREDYEDVLNEYNTLKTSYDSLGGVTATLTPITRGFRFETSIDLENVSSETMKKHFSDSIYYKLDTEAKVIAFELESSGYTCN